MYAQWWLLLLTLPGWLLPSGASLPLCGCLFRANGSDTCCAVQPASEDEAPSCCASEHVDEDAPPARAPQAAPGEEDCCCTVTAPRRDDGPLPLESPRLPPMLPACGCTLAGVVRHLPCGVQRELPRIRGPAPGGACSLPLRL